VTRVDQIVVVELVRVLVRLLGGEAVQAALDVVLAQPATPEGARRSARVPFPEAKRRALEVADPDELVRQRARKARKE
jgi:hypothetical protein